MPLDNQAVVRALDLLQEAQFVAHRPHFIEGTAAEVVPQPDEIIQTRQGGRDEDVLALEVLAGR